MKRLLTVLLLAAWPAFAHQPGTIHDKLDSIAGRLAAIEALLKGSKPPTADVTPAPKPPTTGGIDYSRFVGMTPQEIQSPFGPFQGRGLPAGWDWNAAFAAGVLNPDAKPAQPGPPAPIAGAPFDEPAFNWNTPGSWRRFIAPVTKALAVPASYTGNVRLFVSQTTGNQVDVAHVVVTEGGRVVLDEPGVNTTAWNLDFTVIGGRTYEIAVHTPGAVLSMNLLVGG